MTDSDIVAAAAAAAGGRPRLVGVSSYDVTRLSDGWTFAPVPANTISDPGRLETHAVAWRRAEVPGTVASSLRALGQSSADLERADDYDATDWWFRCRFASPASASEARDVLCFDGLATLADIWLNGAQILSAENMFLAHEVDVTGQLRTNNELAIRFRSLRVALEQRRPRPRWRTKVPEHQQLRWWRTTLLGRVPGWSPPVRAVGPWREVRLERRRTLGDIAGDVRAVAAERGGTVQASLTVRSMAGRITAATLHVGDRRTALSVGTAADGNALLSGSLSMPDAEHWWPHTHGAQPRYPAHLSIVANGSTVELSLGTVAFRRVTLDRSNGGFTVRVNGVDVFCRGACWSTPDIVSLTATDSTYRELLGRARDAGMNMIRVGGTMVYEADAFYDACDELGILVWQDFMFANMDYPAADPAFAASVRCEAGQVLSRLRSHPSLTVLCGNSEVQQQAAMLGLESELWKSPIFDVVLPECVESLAPNVPYVPSTPSGGTLPFHTHTGVAHYYGVGAYRRPLEDARRAGVRFTSECLGFSNVPDARAVDALLSHGESAAHHPRWKSRVPRDHGAGWDFEDVRDHYLSECFRVDPVALRSSDMDRYLALSRVVTGDVMARTIAEWRRAGSACHGALIWLFQDLWSGAGWGLLEASGRPKPAYYAVKRAMQPVAALVTDEGANGLHVHVTNDGACVFDGEIRTLLLREGSTIVASASAPVRVAPRGVATIEADALFGRFVDSAYAYRFGPPNHDVAAFLLSDTTGRLRSDAWHFPLGLPTDRHRDESLSASAARVDDQTIQVVVRASRFAQSVALDLGDFIPDDNYFHIVPGGERTIVARATTPHVRFDGYAQALNGYDAVRIRMEPTAGEVASP